MRGGGRLPPARRAPREPVAGRSAERSGARFEVELLPCLNDVRAKP